MESLFSPNDSIAALISAPNTTCSDLCAVPVSYWPCSSFIQLAGVPCSHECHIYLSLKGGICVRAFPPDADSACIQQCHLDTCPQYCQLVESNFPPQSSTNGKPHAGTSCCTCTSSPIFPTLHTAVTYPTLLDRPELTMDYTSNVTLRKEGVLEVQVNYVPPTPPPPLPFTPVPGFTLPSSPSLPSGITYGLIWKVTYKEDGQNVDRYIPQVGRAPPSGTESGGYLIM